MKWMQEHLQRRVKDGRTEGSALLSDKDWMTRYAFADDVFAEVFFREILDNKADQVVPIRMLSSLACGQI